MVPVVDDDRAETGAAETPPVPPHTSLKMPIDQNAQNPRSVKRDKRTTVTDRAKDEEAQPLAVLDAIFSHKSLTQSCGEHLDKYTKARVDVIYIIDGMGSVTDVKSARSSPTKVDTCVIDVITAKSRNWRTNEPAGRHEYRHDVSGPRPKQ